LHECLADDVGLDARRIEVEVENGEVTLGGTGPPLRRHAAREAHACAILGVLQVRNNLQSREPLPIPAPGKQAGAAAKMGKPGHER
jgi:osmotically-inducible protein OsmY